MLLQHSCIWRFLPACHSAWLAGWMAGWLPAACVISLINNKRALVKQRQRSRWQTVLRGVCQSVGGVEFRVSSYGFWAWAWVWVTVATKWNLSFFIAASCSFWNISLSAKWQPATCHSPHFSPAGVSYFWLLSQRLPKKGLFMFVIAAAQAAGKCLRKEINWFHLAAYRVSLQRSWE